MFCPLSPALRLSPLKPLLRCHLFYTPSAFCPLGLPFTTTIGSWRPVTGPGNWQRKVLFFFSSWSFFCLNNKRESLEHKVMKWRRIFDHMSIIFLLSQPLGPKDTWDKMTGVGVDLIRVEMLLGPIHPISKDTWVGGKHWLSKAFGHVGQRGPSCMPTWL